MKQPTRKSLVLSGWLVALVVAGILAFHVEWRRCTVCGLQQYRRSVLGAVIEAMSEMDYDEFGAAAAWRRGHGRECRHLWN